MLPTEASDAFLPFARPTLGEEEYREVEAVLRSGWLTTGPRVARFEQDLSAYFGGRPVRCVSSATAGLQLVLQALDLQPDDEVITTPLTFVATLNTIVQAGGRPVLVDIDPATRNLEVERVRRAITPKTRALMPVHFAGLPVDLDPLYDLAEKHGLRVVEDCAHAIGASYQNRRIGAFGDVQVMSFHPNKNMTTGEGGAIVTEDEALLRKIERARFHGIDREAFNRFAKGGSQHYDVVMPGYKYNMMDIQAALGLHQLPKLNGFIAARAELARHYQKSLAGLPGVSLPHLPDYPHEHAWHLFTLLVPQRDRFIEAMKERGVGVGLHYTAAHLFTFYQERFGYRPGDFPQAEKTGSEICSLPLFPGMGLDALDRVVRLVQEIAPPLQAA